MHPKKNWQDVKPVVNYPGNYNILADRKKPWLPAAGGAFLQYLQTEMSYALHMAPI